MTQAMCGRSERIRSVLNGVGKVISFTALMALSSVSLANTPPLALYEGFVLRGQAVTQTKCTLTVLAEDLAAGVWSVSANPDDDGGKPPVFQVTFQVSRRPSDPPVLTGQIDARNAIRVQLAADGNQPLSYLLRYWHGTGSHGHSHTRRCVNLVRIQ